MESLCDVLEVRRGVTAVIGGGGKTSLLYRLASELRERGMVLVATTTRILPPAHLPVRHDREGTLRALRANGIACAGTPAEGGKLASFLLVVAELIQIMLAAGTRVLVAIGEPDILVRSQMRDLRLDGGIRFACCDGAFFLHEDSHLFVSWDVRRGARARAQPPSLN